MYHTIEISERYQYLSILQEYVQKASLSTRKDVMGSSLAGIGEQHGNLHRRHVDRLMEETWLAYSERTRMISLLANL